MQIWLLRDPETGRIALDSREPDDASLPRGNRGRGWEIRVTEVSEQAFADLLSASISPAGQDHLHRNLWEKSS